MKHVGVLALWLLAYSLEPFICSAQDYSANLTGSAVVPWVESTGFGQLYMKFRRTQDNLDNSTVADYAVNVNNIGGIISVGLYQAPIGSNGELVASLYGWNGIPDRKMFDGTLRTDTLTKDKLKGPASGRIVSDIEARINDGDLYCLLTTLNNPNGELRGQVVHPDGFTLPALPILGPPVAPATVPVPVVVPTVIATPVPVPVPPPKPSPPPPSPPPPSPVPAVVVTTVPAPSPAPPSPSPSPSTVPAVVPVVVPVPAPSSSSSSPPVVPVAVAG